MDIAANAIEAGLRQLSDPPTPVPSGHVETGPDSTDDPAIRIWALPLTLAPLRAPRGSDRHRVLRRPPSPPLAANVQDELGLHLYSAVAVVFLCKRWTGSRCSGGTGRTSSTRFLANQATTHCKPLQAGHSARAALER